MVKDTSGGDVQVPEADLGRWQWNLRLCLAGGDWGVTVFATSAPHLHRHHRWVFYQRRGRAALAAWALPYPG